MAPVDASIQNSIVKESRGKMDDWVVSKGILFLSDQLEVLEDVTYCSFFVVALPPSDHTAEGTTFTEPFVGDSAKRLIVSDENAVELGCALEVHIIGGPLGEGLDGSNDIPIPCPKGVDEMAVNVGVGVQGEATSHTRLRRRGVSPAKIFGLLALVPLRPGVVFVDISLDFLLMVVVVGERSVDLR